jgi:hypothetical protein
MVGQDAPDHFFEDAEKLLSIWFTTKDGNGVDHGDLKKIPRKKWDELIRSVEAEILSEMGDEDVRNRLANRKFISSNIKKQLSFLILIEIYAISSLMHFSQFFRENRRRYCAIILARQYSKNSEIYTI